MATYTARLGNSNPTKKPKSPFRPKPIEPTGGGQVGTFTGTGTGIDR